MSEPEKKGSPWPWILVPVAAVSMFFVLRECRQKLPPAPDHSPRRVTVPATPETRRRRIPRRHAEAAPAPAPAPQ